MTEKRIITREIEALPEYGKGKRYMAQIGKMYAAGNNEKEAVTRCVQRSTELKEQNIRS